RNENNAFHRGAIYEEGSIRSGFVGFCVGLRGFFGFGRADRRIAGNTDSEKDDSALSEGVHGERGVRRGYFVRSRYESRDLRDGDRHVRHSHELQDSLSSVLLYGAELREGFCLRLRSDGQFPLRSGLASERRGEGKIHRERR